MKFTYFSIKSGKDDDDDEEVTTNPGAPRTQVQLEAGGHPLDHSLRLGLLQASLAT